MTMYYVTSNFLSGATITTSDDAAPDDTFGSTAYLYNQRQSLPYRFTAKADNWIKVDLASAQTITFAGLLNHNFDSGVTATLRGNAADLGNLAAWQAGAAYSTTITYKAHNMGKWNLSENYRWWHLEIDDAANADYPEIGELVLHAYESFTMNYKYPFGRGTTRIVNQNETFFGQKWRTRHAKRKRFTLTFDAFTDAHMVSEIEAFLDTLDGDQPFVFVPSSTGTELWYTYCVGEENINRNFEDLNEISLELEEQVWGIRMLAL